MRREIAGWAWLAIGSLAVAGLFAILLAISRLPGIEHVFPWPLGFFSKGLVIHVIFSLVVWFLSMFALLTAAATVRLPRPATRLAFLGPAGLLLATLAFPLLFVPAFFGQASAALINYIPLIQHPLYDAGLAILALGILLPVIRLFANLPGRSGPLSPLGSAMVAGGVIFVVALVSVSAAFGILTRANLLETQREYLFWGGGHVLQFLFGLLMLTAWSMLARMSLGEDVIDPDIFRLSLFILAVFTLPAPIFYRAFEAMSFKQQEAFRLLKFVMTLPTLMVGVALLASALRRRAERGWPWRDPAFVALAASIVTFAVGGIMGLLISGSDTRTPAHYHAVVGAVSVACMGLFLTWCLRELRRAPVSDRVVRGLLLAYSGGQIVASIGLYLAGGHGAPRKTPGGAASLVDGAIAGMYLHGLGALIAVVGGATFVIVSLRALSRRDVAARAVAGPG